MKKYNLSCLLYFGDAVYIKPDGTEGNDYAMIHNDNTYIFALSKNKSDVPADSNGRIQWIGENPEALKDFLTWLLIKCIQHSTKNNPEKVKDARKIFKYLDWVL